RSRGGVGLRAWLNQRYAAAKPREPRLQWRDGSARGDRGLLRARSGRYGLGFVLVRATALQPGPAEADREPRRRDPVASRDADRHEPGLTRLRLARRPEAGLAPRRASSSGSSGATGSAARADASA